MTARQTCADASASAGCGGSLKMVPSIAVSTNGKTSEVPKKARCSGTAKSISSCLPNVVITGCSRPHIALSRVGGSESSGESAMPAAELEGRSKTTEAAQANRDGLECSSYIMAGETHQICYYKI